MKFIAALFLILSSLVFSIAPAHAQQPADPVAEPATIAAAANFKRLYPKTQVSSFTATPLAGIYEVVMGKNVAYVDETGQYFLFGHLWDMRAQRDLTEGKVPVAQQAQEQSKIDFNALPLSDAIVTVKGDGSRKMAVFSDPDCPYCKQLERSLSAVENVTIYTFMYPLEGMHPDARRKSVAVWCSPDRSKAWSDLMTTGTLADATCADNPVDRNIQLANKLGIGGTPAIILNDGSIVPGARPPAQLMSMLDGVKNERR